MKNKYLSNVSFQKVKGTSLTILFTLFAFTVHAQVGIGTITPDPSAQLDIQSADKGLLIPRVTESTRTTVMLTPATGLLVYQTDGVAPGFYYFDGSAWQPLKTPAAPSGGVIIPYASGPEPITISTQVGGLAYHGAAIGFGYMTNGFVMSTPNLTGIVDNMAFPVPRAGTVASISAFFMTLQDLAPAGSLDIKAQLYFAAAGSHLFAPLLGTAVFLSYTGLAFTGASKQVTVSGLNIPVAAGDRLLLVFSCTETPSSGAFPVSGYAGAGVEIK